MIEELELRIQVTEAQIKQSQKELRKTEDEIKTLEGQILAYKTMLDFIKVKGCTAMSQEQLTQIDTVNKYYQVNAINRRVDYIRFAILNDRERDTIIKTEKELIQRIEAEHKSIMSN